MYSAMQLTGRDDAGADVNLRGIFIHGVKESLERRIGTRASGACIRMTRADSAEIFAHVKKAPEKPVKIRVINSNRELEYKEKKKCLLNAEIMKCVFKRLNKNDNADKHFGFSKEDYTNRKKGDKFSNKAYQFTVGELQASLFQRCKSDKKVVAKQNIIQRRYPDEKQSDQTTKSTGKVLD